MRPPVLRYAWKLALILAMAGCASAPPKPANLSLTLQASPDVNPDAANRPSPIVVRIFQLKGDAAFTSAEFFALYDDEKKELGADLIKRDEFVLRPGDKTAAPLSVSGEARFVGVIAAYRDIRNAQWRVVVPAPLKKNVTVSVGRARVELAAK